MICQQKGDNEREGWELVRMHWRQFAAASAPVCCEKQLPNECEQQFLCLAISRRYWRRRIICNNARKRVKGIEPSYVAWEATVLPLNYTRERILDFIFWLSDCNRNQKSLP